METENQPLQKKPSKIELFRAYGMLYANLVIRTVISLFITTIVFFLINRYLHLPQWSIYLFILFFSIILSPLYAKLHIAEWFVDYLKGKMEKI